MTAVYRIYTEYRPNLLALASEWFSGASLIRVDGLYQGIVEQGAILEIIADDSDVDKDCARMLAKDIATENKQQLVIVLYQTATTLEGWNVR